MRRCKNETLQDTCNSLLWEKVQAIWECINEQVYDFELHLCSNATHLLPQHRERLIKCLSKYQRFSLREHDLSKFSLAILGRSRREITTSLQLSDEQYFERTDGYVRGLIGTVRGDVFVEMISSSDSPSEVERDFFEENVRVYLGEKNEVNQKILSSAVSRENAQFWYLNNGITIVCDSYKYLPKSSSPLVEISNPQIVNGGQTSFALFEAARGDSDRIKNVRVLVRIIETKNPEFTASIAEATNSQTPIRSRDLRANDVIQLKIESMLADAGYLYERKRNQHLAGGKERKIDALKLGQAIFSYYWKEPDRAKAQSDKIFGEYYDLIFDPARLTPEYLLVPYKLYEDLESRRDAAVHRLRSIVTRDYSESWLVEEIFHALFMVGELCERDGKSLTDYSAASKLISEAIEVVDAYVISQKRVSAYRLFRSTLTKSRLKGGAPAAQLEMKY